MTFTEEAREYWDQLSEEEQQAWITHVTCQKCFAPIDPNEFKASVYEGQLALFHMCKTCGNKEVRLIDVNQKTQQEIDDDFARWLDSKQHPKS